MTGHSGIFFSFSRFWRWVGFTAFALSIGLTGPASAQETAQGQFASLAQELLEGIGSASVEEGASLAWQ